MKYYFDTEFTGLNKDADLISIGIITEKNHVFYAEISDYDKSKITDIKWMEEHVICNLLLKNRNRIRRKYKLYNPTTNNKLFSNNHTDGMEFTIIKDTKNDVRKSLLKWFKDTSNLENIELVSDVLHYDMVLLIDLLSETGDALDLPYYIPTYGHDINTTEILRYNSVNPFDVNREELIHNLSCFLNNTYSDELFDDIDTAEYKHNSLYDALVIKIIDNMYYADMHKYIEPKLDKLYEAIKTKLLIFEFINRIK